MILISDPVFCDPKRDSVLPVIELTPHDYNKTTIDKSKVYLIGHTIYRYVGQGDMGNIEPGTIFRLEQKYYVEPYDNEEDLEMYDAKYIVSRSTYEQRISMESSFDELYANYAKNYNAKNNLVKSGNIKIIPSGDVYMPELSPDDDPLERIIKLMLRHMRLVLNDYRGHFSKKHGLDNIKSALNGATKNMSITKFMSWCKTFGLAWEIVYDNISPDVPNPLPFPVVIRSDTEFPWEDIPPETKECFTVPLIRGEDPLKRGTKLFLYYKGVDIRDYRKKSPTPHLINNMKSAIKSRQKMTLPYNISWCEIMDVAYSFKVIGQDGIWFKITGYEVTTNEKEML